MLYSFTGCPWYSKYTVFKVHGKCNIIKWVKAQVPVAWGVPGRAVALVAAVAVVVVVRGRGRGDAPPAAADDDDEDVVLDAMEGTVCSYCTTETEEELKRCISYDTGCKVEWRDVPAWIKTQLGCDKSIHLSCAKKNKAYEGGTPAANASYPEIGFCEGCFKDVEEARVN